MIFHDDDIMGKNCVKKLYNHLEANPDLVACGANGIMFYDSNTKLYQIILSNPIDMFFSFHIKISK